MPTVTQDTAIEKAPRPSAPDPAARIRRLLTSTPGGAAAPEPAQAGIEILSAALARFDAPADLRVRGGKGSGRRTLSAALRARRGWRVTIEDLDDLAAPGAPPVAAPDVEIICLRTAPCRHEESWARRPRRHPMLIVATGIFDDDYSDDCTNATATATGTATATATATGTGTGTAANNQAPTNDNAHPRGGIPRPRWARGLPAVDARIPEDRSVDVVVTFVERALDALTSIRVARLEAELERLAVHPEVGELAEAALCALDQ